MDRLTRERRSWNMAQIRGKDTSPERMVRSLLHKMGYRFRLHYRTLPGNPDIVLPKYKTAVFVHGCFWHRHKGCKQAYTPKTRAAFWNDKFQKNVARDKKNLRSLRELGWRVVVVWECELRNPDTVRSRLRKELRSTRAAK